MNDELVDRIYECAFQSEHWPAVLGELAGLASARAGFLFVSNDAVHHFTSSTTAGREAIQPLVDSGWIAGCERFRRMLAARHSGFVTDSDLQGRPILSRSPLPARTGMGSRNNGSSSDRRQLHRQPRARLCARAGRARDDPGTGRIAPAPGAQRANVGSAST